MGERNSFGQMDLDGLLNLNRDDDGERNQTTGSNVKGVEAS